MNVSEHESNLEAVIGEDILRIRKHLRGEMSEDEIQNTDTLAVSPRAQWLSENLGLTPFESDILLLCAAMTLDPEVALDCAGEKGLRTPYPSFALAFDVFPESHWSAMSPGAPLRAWRLIDAADDAEILQARLTIDERILHFILGMDPVDERLMPFLKQVVSGGWLPASYNNISEQIRHLLQQKMPPVIQLTGTDFRDQLMLAAAVCTKLEVGLFQIHANEIPDSPVDRDSFNRLWRRENCLSGRALFAIMGENPQHLQDLAQGVSPVFIGGTDTQFLSNDSRPVQRINLSSLDSKEQELALKTMLTADEFQQINGDIEKISSHFSLGAFGIKMAASKAKQSLINGEAPDTILWNACRDVSRPQLSALAQEIKPKARWQDLILPDKEKAILKTITMHVRHAHKVYQQGGFEEKTSRGLGISTLFHGDSGTGKTFAAEVLANELNLALYRIDLSSVVSKYIGETEKNLKVIFDAADSGGAILLFDEADALFGKRSEVRDSHDRYANIEVGYLLQRMEAFRGLAILTTNMKNSLDKAFLRRLRFVVEFPFPTHTERSEIWQRIFPTATVTEDLDVKRLAKLNVSGGSIHNIALNAAFFAADEGKPVSMTHIYSAAKNEYAKLEKIMTSVEAESV